MTPFTAPIINQISSSINYERCINETFILDFLCYITEMRSKTRQLHVRASRHKIHPGFYAITPLCSAILTVFSTLLIMSNIIKRRFNVVLLCYIAETRSKNQRLAQKGVMRQNPNPGFYRMTPFCSSL